MSSPFQTLTVIAFHKQFIADATADRHPPRLVNVSIPSSSKKNKKRKTRSWRLQFFVRMMWKCDTLVIRASREDTVETLLVQISLKIKVPVVYLRLIYKGKELRVEQNLGECGVENDSNLQLVGRLKSIACPVVWRATQGIVSLIRCLCRNEVVCDTYVLIENHFKKYMDNPEYFGVFMFMKIPALLVNLLMSPWASNKTIADLSIRGFVQKSLEVKCRTLQGLYIEVVLEFCEMLRGVGCKSDNLLYVYCRNGFATLLAHVGVLFRNSKRGVLLQGVSYCVREVADGLLKYLDSSMSCVNSGEISCSDVRGFVNFSTPLREGMAEQEGEFKNCGVHYAEDPSLAGVVDQLRIVFFQLLSKMDECLQFMENCLANKEQGEEDRDATHCGRSHYLFILTELYHISKLYSGAEEMFWGVLLRRKNMLSYLIVWYAEITDGHRWVLENIGVTNFESRRHLAMMLFPNLNDQVLEFEMLIDRSQVLAESFEYISRAKPDSLEGDLIMEFKNEDARGRGVLREWFVLVCQEIFNPRNTLYLACPDDQRRFFPNAASKVDPLHLKYFSFSGRMIALALKSKVHVGIVFDRVFFKQLAGNYITLEDIRDADPMIYRSYKKILEMNADYIDTDELGLTFSIEVEELGHRRVIELCPGGESIVVDSKNREMYVDLLIQNRFVTSISEQVSHFATGFDDIMYGKRLEFFRYLDLEDLDRMLYGSENAISVEDWKAHTEYDGYKEIDRQISWFWEIVGRMSVEQKKVLLFFWTSVKYLPVEGFRGLASHLSICKSNEPENHLPTSHTCLYELCFPPYSSITIMQDRLGLITQEHMSCSFGIP
ncbi:E3 ubiquitin-protein ligase UPL5-like [Vicia villosa]|uniref:E3 ubiquitin-protein ligase UPL5-like n=1 Tax=Vicia villosa TaxID=3911 RepID=UPI00273C6D4D|nr:E3 ubiquitin-protein ligase UPL5-like [Vicia villosa]